MARETKRLVSSPLGVEGSLADGYDVGKKRERRNTTLIILATVSPMIIGFLVMAIVAYVKT